MAFFKTPRARFDDAVAKMNEAGRARKYATARAHALEAIAAAMKVTDDFVPRVQAGAFASSVACAEGDWAAAEGFMAATVTDVLAGWGPTAAIPARKNLLSLLRARGRFEAAVDQQLALIALAPKEPEKQLIRASMGAELAEFLSKLGRHREAIDLGRTYLQEVQKFVGPGHASFSLAARTLAGLLLTEGKALDEAGSLLSAASRDPATENVMACAALMAQVRLKQGKPADAVTCCEQLVGDLGRLAADTAVPVQAAVENLLEVYADALSSAGRGDDAIANYQVSIARIGRRLGDHSPYLVSPLQKLARACHARGVQDEAARAERRANSISRLVRGSQSPVR